MEDDTGLSPLSERKLRWPVFATRMGMAAERFLRAFWPLWTAIAVLLSAAMLGVHDVLPVELVWALAVAGLVAVIWGLWFGLRRMHWPSRQEAVERLDKTLPGRPIAALRDHQAIGAGDAGSEAVWKAHRAVMQRRLDAARAVEPDLRLSRFDRYGLRYVALTVLAVALLFGSFWRVETLGGMTPGGGGTIAAGPSWEGWIEPPAYTGRPSLYLNDLPDGEFEVPVGSRVSLRLYGEVGDLTISETVSGRTEDVASAADVVQEFEIRNSGSITVSGEGGRSWTIKVLPDTAPSIDLSGVLTREADGTMVQPFTARDDYGVETAQANIALDPTRVERRYGLAIDPEPRAPIILNLPMPMTGNRTEFTESMIEDFSKHPFANLPVTIELTALDAAGNDGISPRRELDTLPGRRFFDPLAKSIVELRRDLLWNRENARHVSQVLRAVSHVPDGIFRSETDYLRTRFIARRLDAAARATIADEFVDETAEAMWQLALRIEEGDLNNALERLRRAQDRLSEAMRNGASNEEIAELMQELRQAMQDFMQQLAEQSQRDGNQLSELDMENMQELSGDQLQEMLDQLQQLMEEGRMAEAQQLLDRLAQMMQNLRMAQQGQGGQGSPGQQAMQGLQETLRDQQNLSDESFQELQDQFNQGQPGQGQSGQQGEGEQFGQGQGNMPGDQPGQGQGQSLSDQLANRQESLRDTLRQQQSDLPGGGEAADAARDALDRAGRAMDRAEDALRGNELAEAIDNQAEAMEELREGIRNLGEEMAQQQQGQGQEGQQMGEADGMRQGQDPLGRQNGGEGPLGTRDNMLQDEDVYKRARDLLDEIRRRSSDQTRPDMELDYLKRLLDRF